MSRPVSSRGLSRLLLLALIAGWGVLGFSAGEPSSPGSPPKAPFEAVSESNGQSPTPRAKRGRAYLRSCVCWRCKTLNFGPPSAEKFTCKNCGFAYATKDGRILEVDATEAEVLLRERARIEEEAKARELSQPSGTGPTPATPSPPAATPAPLPLATVRPNTTEPTRSSDGSKNSSKPSSSTNPDQKPLTDKIKNLFGESAKGARPSGPPPTESMPPTSTPPAPASTPFRMVVTAPAPPSPTASNPAPAPAPVPALPPAPEAKPPVPGDPSPDTPAGMDALLDKLAMGALAFNTPGAIPLKQSTTIQLLLSPSLTAEQLAALIKEPGKVETAKVKISSSMEAKLTAGPAFSIQAISPDEQMISQAKPTEWNWSVTALEPGKHRLHLVVNAIVRVNGGEKRRMLETFNREIQVMVPEVAANPLAKYAVPAGLGLFLLGAGVALWCIWNRRHRIAALSPSAPAADCEVFISYARRDLAQVQPLVTKLQERGIKVWLDVEGIEGATVWAGEIADAIRACRAVVLMASRAAFGSEYVRREILLAADEHKPIVPLYLESAEIPPALRLQLAGIQTISLDRAGYEEGFEALVRALARFNVPQPDENAETEAS